MDLGKRKRLTIWNKVIFMSAIFVEYSENEISGYSLGLRHICCCLPILFINLQRQSCCIREGLSNKFYIGLLLNIHLHANIHDPWNNIHVFTCWGSFWSD